MKQRVLITGYNGFLGKHVVDALLGRGWQTVTAGRLPPRLTSSAETHFCDLEDLSSVAKLATIEPCQAVVHLAAKIGWTSDAAHELLVPNVLATGLLAETARNWDAFIVYASAAIVHGARTVDINRKSSILADIPYGQSKLLGENVITLSAAKACFLRFGGLYGLDGPQHLGLNKAITAALHGVSPTLVGQGTAQRNYLYVKDAAHTVATALENQLTGVHLAAGKQALSIREMLETVCQTMMPGTVPNRVDGAEARTQLIASSPDLPPGRTFAEAMADIQQENKAKCF